MKQLSILLLIVLYLSLANGLIHHLHIREDTRGSFFIENFGFLPEGTLHLNLTNFQVDVGSQNPANHRFGIVIKHSLTDYHRFLQDQAESECLLDTRFNTNDPNDQVILLTNWQETTKAISIPNNGAGYYSIYFISCEQTEIPVSFDLELIMYNPGPDYLSAGQTPLPTVYVLYSVAYFVAIVGWLWFFMLPREGHVVLLIHYLMTVTVLLKFGSVFFHSVELHYLKSLGHPGGWTWVYLVFSFLKGITFFVVIALIGTGWAFVKPYLNERDKNVILIVIPLQVISNIALIVLEETSPGSQSYFTFYDIFRLVDIVCCVAVLVPVIGSIRHLQEAAQVDGKAAKNVEKLKLFREFYMLVVSYIYFTRIIVFLLESTLFYNWVWLSTFVSELCTLGFFIATGYYFRPVEDNPYLKIDKDFATAGEADSDSV